MNKILVRKVRVEDLKKVAEIQVTSWKTAYEGIVANEYLKSLSIDEKYQKRLKAYKEDGFLVAEINNEIVGFCRYKEENLDKEKLPNVDCELCALYVETKNKNNGIGTALMNYVVNKLKKQGHKKMIIWCFKDNYPARFFYEKMGATYGTEGTITRGGKDYKKVSYIYDLEKLPKEELELVFPTNEYKSQVEEYLQEFLDNGEDHIPGIGGLDRIKDFDTWLQKIQNDLSEETVDEDRVPATFYLTIRKSDRKIVGNLQIRHLLNEKLLNYGGHIGDAIRPSERKKGYATEQIRLALKKCKELGIDNVMMDCDKENIGSAKSIQNNGGILENEVYVENELVQRYWISLKKRYAYKHLKNEKDIICKSISTKTNEFTGDIFLYELKNVKKRYVLPSGVCIIDNDYKWLEFYDYNLKIKLTATYNEKNKIIEWYFDISRKIGKENGIPYEDDLYLDVLVVPNGEIKLLDEDELETARKRLEVSENDYKMAYKEANNLIEKLKNNKEKLKEFTDKYLKELI